MRKVQTKLIVLSIASISCVVCFAGLFFSNIYGDYKTLSSFQQTSAISAAAAHLSTNLTAERQAGYAAATFLGEGTPQRQLEAYEVCVKATRESLDQLRQFVATHGQNVSSRFKDGLQAAIDAEGEINTLRSEILDKSRPLIRSTDETPLKAKTLRTYDVALQTYAKVLPLSANETQDGELVRRIITQDNIARLQKDFWKLKGLVATVLRTDKLTLNAQAEIKAKLGGIDEQAARLQSFADPVVRVALERLQACADYTAIVSIANRAMALGPTAPSFKELGEHPAYMSGPNSRIEAPFAELIAIASQQVADYTAHRLAQGRLKLILLGGFSLVSIIGITAFMAYVTRSITLPLHRVSTELGETANGADQSAQSIAQSSSQLSDDACEQAAALEEISASMDELTGMNSANLDNMQKIAGLAENAKESTERGGKNVAELCGALADIQKSTADVASILKTIDEIAFQTNILALNAAVEAARAGEAGAGFAIVADEVRTLAQRSATAARETALKIESAVKTSARGANLGERAEKRFTQISTITAEYHKIVKEVEIASQQTAQGLTQVSEAVQKVDQITQRTAAAAEENAAASTEMLNQVEHVFDYVHVLERMILSEQQANEANQVATSNLAGPNLSEPITQANPTSSSGKRSATPSGRT